MSRNKVKAILNTDLEDMLKKTNQYEEIINGAIKCKNCNTTITVENIGVIVPVIIENKSFFEFYCERVDCIEQFNKENNEN